MPVAQGPAGPRRRLGAELRRLREASGLHLDAVADELGCSTSKLSRLENGKGIPKLLEVREMLRIYGPLPEHQRDRLVRLARDGRAQTWWQEYADVLSRATSEFDRFVALENDASTIRAFELGLVHGLLQIPAYSRGLLEGGEHDLDARDHARLLEVRARRREVLTRTPNPLRLHVVLDESALRRVVGSTTVMAEQLQNLLEVARRPNVTLTVIPFSVGAHAGLNGTFSIIEFDDDDERDVVYLESKIDTYLETPAQVKEYAIAFDELCRRALDPEQTLSFIGSILPEFDS